MTLSERLRKIRGQLGQKEFAERIGSSQTGVSAYEKGQRKPDYETLIRVSQEFGVTLDWLLLGVGPMYCSGQQEEKMTDSRPIGKKTRKQYIDNIDKKNITSQQGDRQSAVFDYMEKTIRLQERITSLLEEKAELQVALERASMNIERRDQRIRELEKENAGLREAQKGPAFVRHTAAGEAN